MVLIEVKNVGTKGPMFQQGVLYFSYILGLLKGRGRYRQNVGVAFLYLGLFPMATLYQLSV